MSKIIESKILLVDDSRELRGLLRAVLESEGATVFEEEGGNAAVKFLSLQTVDLVLSDIDMPDGNGLMLFTYLKRQFPMIPVVLMSGSSYLCEVVIGLGAGFVLEKPFQKKQLLEAIRNGLKSRTESEITQDRAITF